MHASGEETDDYRKPQADRAARVLHERYKEQAAEYEVYLRDMAHLNDALRYRVVTDNHVEARQRGECGNYPVLKRRCVRRRLLRHRIEVYKGQRKYDIARWIILLRQGTSLEGPEC